MAGHGLKHIRSTGVGLGIPQWRLLDKEMPRVGAAEWLGLLLLRGEMRRDCGFKSHQIRKDIKFPHFTQVWMSASRTT